MAGKDETKKKRSSTVELFENKKIDPTAGNQDFFRGSRRFSNKIVTGFKRDFTGFRRGSR